MQFCSSLELRNFYALRKLDVKFGTGPVGIIGRNGAGKSTLLTSMYWLLTGDLSRFPRTKENVVSHFRRDKEPAYGKGVFFLGGKRAMVYRSLIGNKVELRVEGEAPVEGSTAVNARILQLLGVPKTALANFMFIDQKGLLAALQDGGRKRLRDLSDTCGIPGLEAKHKAITEAKAAYELEAAVDASQVLELEKELAEIVAESKKADEARSSAAAMVMPEDTRNSIGLLLEQHQNRIRLETALRAANKQLREIDLEVRAAELDREGECVNLADIKSKRTPLADLKAKSLRLKRKRELHDDYLKAKEAHETLRDKFLELEKSLAADIAAKPEQSAIDEAADRCREIKSEMRPLEALISSTADNCQCPTCLRSVDAETIELAKNRIDSLIPQFSTAKAELAALSSLQVAALRAEGQLLRAEDEVKVKANHYLDLQQAVAQARALDRDSLEIQLQAVKRKIETERERRKEEHACGLRYERAASRHLEMLRMRNRVIIPQIRTLKSELTAAPAALAQEQVDELQKTLKAAQTKEGLYNEACGYSRAIDLRRSELQRRIGAMKTKSRRADSVRNLLGPLELAADALHWQNLPRKVVARQLQPIAQRASQDLEAFGSPFKIRVLEDMTIEAAFPGEPWLPADALSIGQQCVLCLPLAVAAVSMHYPSVGVLALDEPGADLDEQNTAYFSDYISALAEKHKALQVFVVTHAKSMSGAFKQVVELMPQR